MSRNLHMFRVSQISSL